MREKRNSFYPICQRDNTAGGKNSENQLEMPTKLYLWVLIKVKEVPRGSRGKEKWNRNSNQRLLSGDPTLEVFADSLNVVLEWKDFPKHKIWGLVLCGN